PLCVMDGSALPSWSLSQMQRVLQFSLGWCVVSLAVVAALGPDRAIPAHGALLDNPPAITPAQHKPYTVTIPGSPVKFDMVAIPGGTFLMGSPANEAGRQPDEGPQHLVTIRQFWMGKTEVTWDEYDQYWKQEE